MQIPHMIRRRKFLAGTSAFLGAATLATPFLGRAALGTTLRVGTYGGYFQDSFDAHIYPEFTKDTGIPIESIREPTGDAWLVRLETAALTGQTPADVSMMAQVSRLKGEKSKLWAPLDEAKIPNSRNLPDHFVHRYDDGAISGVGAVSWYITLMTNTEVYPATPISWQHPGWTIFDTQCFPSTPVSWKVLWNPEAADNLGLFSLATNSFLLEITAKTWFGSTEILETEEGILQVMDKLSEVKPNGRLWYRDESQFQQALETGEVTMGQYYHDVAGLAAFDRKPVRSTFPEEGGVLDSGSWSVSNASERLEEAHIFIDYMCLPSIQSKMSRLIGTAPTIKREMTDLTEEEFATVSSDISPIIPRYDVYEVRRDWVSRKWSELTVE